MTSFTVIKFFFNENSDLIIFEFKSNTIPSVQCVLELEMKVRLVLPIYQYFQLTHEKGLKNRDIKITIYIFETHSSRIHTPVNQDYLSSPAADVKEYAIGTELRTRLGK